MLLKSDSIEFSVNTIQEIIQELSTETDRTLMIYDLTRSKMKEALEQDDLDERIRKIEDYLKEDVSVKELNKMLVPLGKMICKSQIKIISLQNIIGGI